MNAPAITNTLLTDQHRRDTWIVLSLVILGALLYGFTVFQYDYFRMLKRGENGQAAIQMLDEMRSPFLELKQAELRLLQSAGESSAISGIESAIHDGRQTLSEYLELASYNEEVRKRVVSLQASYEAWVSLELELVRVRAFLAAGPGMWTEHAELAVLVHRNSSAFLTVMDVLADGEKPIHHDIHAGAAAVRGLLASSLTFIAYLIAVAFWWVVLERAALRESEKRHSAVIASALDAIVVNDERGRITEFNPAAERTFGYRQEEAVGRDLAELLIPDSGGGTRRQAFREELARGIPAFQGGRVEVPALHADGHEFPIELVVQRIDRGGQIFFIAFARDITEREQARSTLEQTYRMKSEFMANVTHELRTPLNSVIGFAELLKDEVPGPLNPKQAAFAADILASGQRLLTLVEGILEMSRLDAAGAALQREPVAIGAALEARVAAHRKAAEARGLTMRLDVTADTGSAQLDPRALRRMLDALLDNAVKFNRDGGAVAVSARCAGRALEIVVADTGIGIACENLAKLFKPLVQLDAGLARQHGGVGLGLALARRLAELHGGTLEVESESGKGSTFTLRLPIQEDS